MIIKINLQNACLIKKLYHVKGKITTTSINNDINNFKILFRADSDFKGEICTYFKYNDIAND